MVHWVEKRIKRELNEKNEQVIQNRGPKRSLTRTEKLTNGLKTV